VSNLSSQPISSQFRYEHLNEMEGVCPIVFSLSGVDAERG
jgi:hypothetical protein